MDVSRKPCRNKKYEDMICPINIIELDVISKTKLSIYIIAPYNSSSPDLYKIT